MPPRDPANPASRTAPLADEEAVIARAANGDRAAFTQLIEHYQSACYGLAWRLLGDPDQAADAAQDAFVHAYDAIAKYRGGLFRSWLLRITANASYDILRRAQRKPTTTLPDAEEGEAELPTAQPPIRRRRRAATSCTATSTSPCGACPRTSAPRSCCATSTGWTTARWPTRPSPRSGPSSRGSTGAASACAN